MEPIIIFNEKYYPKMEDYTDEKGITKKAPFIQIGETMVRVIQPRKVGEKFWQHLQGSDVKIKKKTDFGTVVENYIQLTTKGYEQNFVKHGKMFDSDFETKMNLSRNSLKPYKDAKKALKIEELIEDTDEGTKTREVFVPLKKAQFLQKYEKEIEGWKKSIYRQPPKKQKTIYSMANATIYRFFQGNNKPVGWKGMNMTMNEFFQKGEVNMEPEQKIEKMEELMRPVKAEFNRLKLEEAKRTGIAYDGTAWMSMMGVIRPFTNRTAGVTIPDGVPPTSPFSRDQEKGNELAEKGNVGKYSHLSAEPDQIRELKNCLLREDPSKTSLFAFLIGLEMGLRENELFTLSAMKIVSGKSGVALNTAFDKKTYEISVRTRKGEWHGISIHKGLVQDKLLVSLIEERYNQVKDGIRAIKENPKLKNKELLKKYGIVKTAFDPHDKIDIPVTDHALIGTDNEFYKVTELQDSIVRTSSAASTYNNKSGKENLQEKMRIFRKCYDEVGLDDPYWTKKPFHSIRHIFAHYWLRKTDWNYEQVAKQGHWGATTELKRSYGQLPDELFYADVINSFDNPDLSLKEIVAKKTKGKQKEFEATKQIMQDEIKILDAVEAKKERL